MTTNDLERVLKNRIHYTQEYIETIQTKLNEMNILTIRFLLFSYCISYLLFKYD